MGDIGAVVELLSDLQTFQADAKSSLAVLHNRKTMVNLFRASNWVTEIFFWSIAARIITIVAVFATYA